MFQKESLIFMVFLLIECAITVANEYGPESLGPESFPLPGYKLVWEEDFSDSNFNDGEPDPASRCSKKGGCRWNADNNVRKIGDKDSEATYNTTHEAISMDHGLTIKTYNENGENYTGYLSSVSEFTYGYFEAIIRFNDEKIKNMPASVGAFWLQSRGLQGGYGHVPVGNPSRVGVETDIVEHYLTPLNKFGVDYMTMSLHWDGYDRKKDSNGKEIESAVGYHQQASQPYYPLKSEVALQGNYHRYGVLWTPTAYTFYLDGKVRWKTSHEPVSQRPQFIIFNTAIKTDDKAVFGSHATTHTSMQVKSVKVWQKAADLGDCGLKIFGSCPNNQGLSNYSGQDDWGKRNLQAGVKADVCARRATEVSDYCGGGAAVQTTFGTTGSVTYAGAVCGLQVFGKCKNAALSNLSSLDHSGMKYNNTGNDERACVDRAQEVSDWCGGTPVKTTFAPTQKVTYAGATCGLEILGSCQMPETYAGKGLLPLPSVDLSNFRGLASWSLAVGSLTKATGGPEVNPRVCSYLANVYSKDICKNSVPVRTYFGGIKAMYRLYNSNAANHIFTTNRAEHDRLVGTYHLKPEGRPFKVYSVEVKVKDIKARAIHRLYDEKSGNHYLTTNDNERALLEKKGWKNEKSEGYLFPNNSVPGSKEVFHLYNRKTGDHLYTIYTTEVSALVTPRSSWVKQASLGFSPP